MSNKENKSFMLANRYQLIGKIGSGGMAHVYKAKDHRLNRHVAIKILKSEFTHDEDFIRSFNNEAKAAASLTHPNIVSVYDVGCENNIHYIVMEYVDGITLKALIDQKKSLKWKDSIIITKQIVSAIEAAHKFHIVHRDIKPHNIMLTKNGTAKVTDFGIARAVSDSTIKISESNMGSVHYLSPEQAKGIHVDERSDLYSIGITLYEMLTGRVPFDGDSSVCVAMMHINNRIVPPIEVNKNIPIAVNDFVVKATQKNPINRYQTATEMLADIAVVLMAPHKPLEVSRENNQSYANRNNRVNYKNIDNKSVKAETNIEDVDDENISRLDSISIANLAKYSVAIVLSIIISFVSFAISLGVLKNRIDTLNIKEYSVDNYVGKDINEVEALLQSYGIKVEKVYVPSSEAPNTIVAQFPDSGIIRENDKITFNICKNEDDYIVGEYAGKDFRLVEEDFKDSGVKVRIVNQYSNSVREGNIIGTRPGAGSALKSGETLVVFMSKGNMYLDKSLPDFKGKHMDEAKQMLETLGLKPVIMPYVEPKIEEEEDNQENINENEGLENDELDNEGKEEENNFENQEPTNAPINEPTPTPDPNLGKIVVTQYPAPGTKVMSGDKVILYMSPIEHYREIKELIIRKEDEMGISGDFSISVELIPSDTKVKELVFEGVKNESEFPLSFEIGVPKDGHCEVNIFINGNLYCKYFFEDK